jgi:hypothetical protein
VQKRPSSLGVLGEDDRVCAGDHGGDRSAGYWSAEAGGRELSTARGPRSVMRRVIPAGAAFA